MDDISPAACWLSYGELGNGRGVTPRSDIQGGLREAIRDAVTQLEYAEQRVEDERALARRARNRAEEVERRQAAVIARLTAEQQDLRHQLDSVRAAELSAREEASVAHARLAAMMARGMWARLRNKTHELRAGGGTRPAARGAVAAAGGAREVNHGGN